MSAGTNGASAAASSESAAAELLGELERLVQIVARKPRLALREGAPGCGWAFDWSRHRVTVDPTDVRTLAPDLCRGLTVHEASHAAITVVQDFLPRTTLCRYIHLINAVEDLRIDAWSASRFPGSAPWLMAHNAVAHGMIRERGLPRSRQAQFLLGMLERGSFGTTAAETLPEVVTALDACQAAVDEAVACQPPPGDTPAGIATSQQRMWSIVRDRIVPTWTALVKMDRADGIGALARRELEAFATDIADDPSATLSRGGRHRHQGAAHRRLCLPGGAADPRAPDPAPAGDASAAAAADFADRYEAAWKRVAAVADRLGDDLLRVLVPRRRMHWSDGHASGPRLLTRRAVQYEADPRQYRSLWSRPILPHRCDPAVLLLVDRSGSMQPHLAEYALEGTVLLTEVCHRIGVAAAVWSFATTVTEELAWDAALDGAARRCIGSLPSRCDDMTDMAAALAVTGHVMAARRADPKILFVIGDGEPDNAVATRAAADRLEREGIVTIGLGLGPCTAGLARYFDRSAVEIGPEKLVDHLAGLLGEALLATA